MSVSESVHIAFTGWGSGGHISPIGSLIEYGLEDSYLAEHCKLFRFGEQGWIEETYAAKYQQVTFVPIPAGKMRRYRDVRSLLHNIRDLRKALSGIVVAYTYLKRHRIDVVFCKGGYVALPVCLAARLLRVHLVVHESDMHAWLTNRLAAKMATKVFSWFPDVIWQSVVVWQLLSPKLLSPDKKLLPLIDVDTKTMVLVMGWSQWAASIFDSILTLLEHKLIPESFYFLVLLGTKNAHYEEAFSCFPQVKTYTFISMPEELAGLYQASDLAVTRWSMTSLAEQQLYGIAKCIVPLPYTWGNHQYYNAQWCVTHRGDTLVEQDSALAQHLQAYFFSHQGYKKQQQAPDTALVITPLKTIWHALLPRR